MKAPRLLAISNSDFDPASRFRVMQLLPHFAAAGWSVTHRPFRPSLYWESRFKGGLLGRGDRARALLLRNLTSLARFSRAGRYDVVLVSREIPHHARLLRRVNPRIVFDLDDAIYLGERDGYTPWMCGRAAWVVAGSETLAAEARRFTERVSVIPTLVEVDRYLVSEHGEEKGRLRVGWLGSDFSIRETLFPFLGLLADLQREIDFELVVVSRPRPHIDHPALRWSFLEWSPESEREIARHLDVGIMPLLDTPYQRAKCGTKLLQYMAAGLPAIASPVGANRSLVADGETGFLAHGPADWRSALAALRDPERRRAMGAAGRALCAARYSARAWLPAWLEVLERVAQTPASRPPWRGRARTGVRRAARVALGATFSVADAAVRATTFRREPPLREDGRRRGLILATHGLGDVVLARDALRALAARWREEGLHVTLLCDRATGEFVARYVGPDAVLGFDRARFWTRPLYRASVVRALYGANFAAVLQPCYNRYLLVEDALVRATAAPARIGSAGAPMFIGRWERALGDRWYTRLVPAVAGTRHELERNREMVDALDTPGFVLRPPALPLEARAPARPGRSPYLLVATDASSPLKAWPLARFEAVAHHAAERLGLAVVFCGRRPAGLASRFARWNGARFEDLTGTTDLAAFLDWIAGARVVLSNDSAAAHLAVALEVPAVCVAGGGIVGRYHPYPDHGPAAPAVPAVAVAVEPALPCFDCGWSCPFVASLDGPTPCVRHVPVRRVVEALARQLEARAPRAASVTS